MTFQFQVSKANFFYLILGVYRVFRFPRARFSEVDFLSKMTLGPLCVML